MNFVKKIIDILDLSVNYRNPNFSQEKYINNS